MFMVGGIMSYAGTIYFPAMMKEMGWSPADLALVFSILMWSPIILSPVGGWLTDRLGPRKTLLLGSCAFMISGLLMATVSELWHVVVYYSVITGVGQALVMGVTVQTLLRKWFMKRAGLVVSIMFVCSAIFQAIMFPTLVRLSMTSGFRPVITITTLVTQGIAILLIFLIVRDSPEKMGLNMDGMTDEEKNAFMAALGGELMSEKANTLGEAIRTPQFWLWTIAYGICAGVLMGLMGNVTTIGISFGFDAASVGIIMTYFMGVSIVGRLGSGWLGDKFGKRSILIVATAMTGVILACAYFAVSSASGVSMMYAALGLFIMAPMVLMFPFIGDLFGRANMGKIMGVGLGCGTVLVGAFPMVAGIIRSMTGSFSPFMALAAAAMFVAAILLVSIAPTETMMSNMGVRK